MLIKQKELEIVKKILRKHLPERVKVWVFGSRVRGINIKPFSDLDLALDDCGNSIPIKILIDLAYSFEESDLPWKVDILDMVDIDEAFRSIINNDKELLEFV